VVEGAVMRGKQRVGAGARGLHEAFAAAAAIPRLGLSGRALLMSRALLLPVVVVVVVVAVVVVVVVLRDGATLR